MNRFNFTFYDASGVIVESYGDTRDSLDACRRVLLLPPGEGKAYKKKVLGDTWESVLLAGGKPPHILPCSARKACAVGPWGYESFYSIVPLEWEVLTSLPVPDLGDFSDYAGQQWDFYRRRMATPWLPTKGQISTLPWAGYALAESPPAGFTFQQSQDFCQQLVKAQEPSGTGSLILPFGMQFAVIRKEKA